MEAEDEVVWLRHAVMRLRNILRYAKDPRAIAGLKELIAQAEARLEKLDTTRLGKRANPENEP
jgi:hypothetical protein